MANRTVISNIFGALTIGSVLFANGSGVVSQDNANFFWDDTNNRLGIGTSSPTSKLDVVSNSMAMVLRRSTLGNAIYLQFRDSDNSDKGYVGYGSSGNTDFYVCNQINGGLQFVTNNTTKAVINSNGFFGIGKASPTNVLNVLETNSNNTTAHIEHSATSGTIGGMQISFTGYSPSNTTSYFLIGVDTSATRFIVYSNGNIVNTNGSYGAISDVKIKDNIVDTSNKLEKLLKVRVVNYTLKDDPENKPLIGVIAQELENVFGGLVEDITRKIKDENGNEIDDIVKSVKYSVFVPILIKALQEEDAKVQALTDKVNTLETELANTKKELSDLKQLLKDKGII